MMDSTLARMPCSAAEANAALVCKELLPSPRKSFSIVVWSQRNELDLSLFSNNACSDALTRSSCILLISRISARVNFFCEP